MKGMKFEQLILDAFDQLAPHYTSEKVSTRKNTTGMDISANYRLIQAKLSASTSVDSQTKDLRLLPPQLTPQALGKFLGQENCCWVLEDFHKIDENDKSKLSQLLKVFMDLSDDYPELKIIALGAVDTARQVIDYDPEMRYRVAEIHVGLMTEREIAAIISKGEAALNIDVTADIKQLISKYSNGLPSVCHHLCLNICDAIGLTQTYEGLPFQVQKVHFERAVKAYVEDASDSIKGAFDKALRQRRKTQYHNAQIALEVLASLPESGGSRSELHQRILRTEKTYPETNLKYILQKLSTPEYGLIVRFDSNSGLFSFADPIYRAFALAHFRDRSVNRLKVQNGDLEVLLDLLTAELRKGGLGSARISISTNKT